MTTEMLFNKILKQFSLCNGSFSCHYISREDLPSLNLQRIFDVTLDATSEVTQHLLRLSI